MNLDREPQTAEDVLRRREDQWFERKSGRVEPKDLGRPLVAFANAEGGYLVVGAYDGVIDGVPSSKLNAIRQSAVQYTEPPVRAKFAELTLDQKTVVVVSVSPGDQVHRTKNHDVYLRIGDVSRKLTYTEITELGYDRGAGAYDGTAAPVDMSALDGSAVEQFAQLIGASSPQKALEARSLLTRQGEVTVAALLLFGHNPQTEFPQAYVRVLAYRDVHRRAGAEQTLIEGSDSRFGGTLVDQITSAAKAVRDLVPERRALSPAGVFEGTALIPADAWMEGLVNAVVHRSYSMAGDHVRVEIFPNRIEFHSPGRFPGIVDLKNPLQIARHARNPRIARVLADLGYAQELGEGVRRMYSEMARQRLTAPKFAQGSSSVTLTLSSQPALPPSILGQLTSAELEMLESLQPIHEGLRTGEVADLIGVSRPTALRRLRRLRDLDLITWKGSSEKDPSAVWSPRN